MLKGSISLTSTGSWAGRIDWTAETLEDENASAIQADCYVWRTDGGESFGNNPYWGKLWIGSRQESFSFPIINGEAQHVGSCWSRVRHSEEGEKKVLIGAEIFGSDHNDLTDTTLTGEKRVKLPSISQGQPSAVTLSADKAKMGDKLLITLNRSRPELTHRLSFYFESGGGLIADKVGGSYQWTIPDLSARCELSGKCQVICHTFLREKRLGTTQAEFLLSVPDPVKARMPESILGKETKIQCLRGADNFLLELQLILGDTEYAVGRGKMDLLAFVPPYDLALAMQDQKVLTGILRTRTFNNDALVGTEDSPVKLTVPENEATRPEITSLVLTPVTGEYPKDIGYIRGKTGLSCGIVALAACSSIQEFSVQAGTCQAFGSNAVIPILQDAGLLTVTAKVTDLRGFTAAKTAQIQVLPYEAPAVVPLQGSSRVICARADENGALTDLGTFLKIQAAVKTSGPEGKNPGSLSYRYRAGDFDFSRWFPLESPADVLLDGVVISTHNSYQVELRAEDSLGESSILGFSIAGEAVSFSLYPGEDGAAFGKLSERPHVVDLAEQMTLLVRGKLELPGEKWQALGLAPGIGTPTIQKGQVTGCAWRLRGGNQVILSFCCRMPGEGMAVNGKPLPEACRPKYPTGALNPSEGGLVLTELGTDGFLRVSPVSGSKTPGWIQGRLSYFI